MFPVERTNTEVVVRVGTFAGRQLRLECRRSGKGWRLLRCDWRQQAALCRQAQLLAHREQRLPEHRHFCQSITKMVMERAVLLAAATSISCATLDSNRSPFCLHLAVEEGQRGKGRPEGRQQLERTKWSCGLSCKPRHRALPAPLLVGCAAGGAAAGVELLGGGELALAAWLQGKRQMVTVSFRTTQLAVRSNV